MMPVDSCGRNHLCAVAKGPGIKPGSFEFIGLNILYIILMK
jgi:hypothetical protein